MSKYPNTLGRIEAVWNKLGGEEGVDRFLRGEITVSEPARKWREQDGVIYFSVTSNGMTGEQWITHLEAMGFRISVYAKSVLRSPEFKPTNGVTTEVAVLKGMLFKDSNRFTEKIRANASERKFTSPNAEIACLIREKFTDEEIAEMNLVWIITMHEPIKDSDDGPRLLGALRFADGLWLDMYCGGSGGRWDRGRGFAFAVSQVSALETQAA